jgi:hypothetical protein
MLLRDQTRVHGNGRSFLASLAGDFVVGLVITVDGGIAFAVSPAR